MTSNQKQSIEDVQRSEEQHVDKLKIFSKNLRYLRKQKNEKQDALAHAIGISQSMISGYEKGVKLPSAEVAFLICDHYDVSMSELFEVDLKHYTQISHKMPSAALIGVRKMANPQILSRFENTTLHCYYYSGASNKKKLRHGLLRLYGRGGEKGSFVFGKLKTAQSYLCKLVVEHPQYIYLFGDNEKNPERMVMVFHEPRYTEGEQVYCGGVGFCLSVGSEKQPVFQKVLLASKDFDLEKEADRQYLDSCLKLDDDVYEYILTEDDDFGLYERLKECTSGSN